MRKERERSLFSPVTKRILLPTTSNMTHILTVHKTIKYNPLWTHKQIRMCRHTHTPSLKLRSLEVILCSAIFTFRVWIVPLYSVFPVVTLTQTKRKWRGEGEYEDRRSVPRTLPVSSARSELCCMWTQALVWSTDRVSVCFGFYIIL